MDGTIIEEHASKTDNDHYRMYVCIDHTYIEYKAHWPHEVVQAPCHIYLASELLIMCVPGTRVVCSV